MSVWIVSTANGRRCNLVDELDRGLLIQLRIDSQHPRPGAVVDRGELVLLVAPTASAGYTGDRFDELHVDLHVMAWPLFLVALPPFVVPLVALRGRQPTQVQPLEDAPHAGLAISTSWYRLRYIAICRGGSGSAAPGGGSCRCRRGWRSGWSSAASTGCAAPRCRRRRSCGTRCSRPAG
jgi:hypothetical protein